MTVISGLLLCSAPPLLVFFIHLLLLNRMTCIWFFCYIPTFLLDIVGKPPIQVPHLALSMLIEFLAPRNKHCNI